MSSNTGSGAVVRAAVVAAALACGPAFAGQLWRVDIKSDNTNTANIDPAGGNASQGFIFPPEGGSLGGNTDSTIGPQSSPPFEAWLIDGGQVIDLGTGDIIEDPRLNRYDFVGVANPNLTAYVQANAGELLNSIAQFQMVPNTTASTSYYFNELYRDYLIVSPPRQDPNTTPTMTLNIADTTGATLQPNSPYNVTLFAYSKPFDASGNNDTSVNSAVYGNNTFHITDNTEGGLGSNTDNYQFVRPVPYPGALVNTNSNPDTPPDGIFDNYTWSATITVFTDANGQINLSQMPIREQSITARSNPLGFDDPQRFQLDFPVLSGFEINDDVVRYVGANGGNWSIHTNWAPGPNNAAPTAPNKPSAIANFFSAGDQNLTLDTNVTVANINFNAAPGTGTTISNAGDFTITLDSIKGPNASVAIASRAGTHFVDADVILKDRSSSNVNTGSSVIFSGDLTTATTLVTERTTNTQQNINLVLRFDKVGGGTLGFRSMNGVPQVRVYGGTLQTSGGVSKTEDLLVNTGARLDLVGDSAWVLDYTGASPLATIESLVLAARNGGTWDAPGITSSRAAADPTRFAVAFAEASALGSPATFPGTAVAIDNTAVLFRVTILGDADLDGTVGFVDLLRVAQAFNGAGTWINGDSNYDGNVDFADLLALARNYGVAALASDVSLDAAVAAQFESDWNLARSIVPEPASLAAVAGMSLLTLRRRRG